MSDDDDTSGGASWDYEGLLYCDALPIATTLDLNLVDVMTTAAAASPQQTYSGTSTVSFQIEQPSTCLFFHSHPDRVKIQNIRLLSGKHVLRPKGVHNADANTAAVNNLPLKWNKDKNSNNTNKPTSVSLSEKLPDLPLQDLKIIELPQPLSYCVVDILFDFQASLGNDNDMTGVYIASTRPAGTIAHGVALPHATCLVATHFEVDHAHKAFPCVDFVFSRQTVKFVLTVPSGSYCRANGGSSSAENSNNSASSSSSSATSANKKEVLPPSVRPIPFYIAGFIASTIPLTRHLKQAVNLPAIGESDDFPAVEEECVDFCVVTTYDSQFMVDLALKSLEDAAIELRQFMQCGLDLPHLFLFAMPKLCLGGMENDGFIFIKESIGISNQSQPGQGRRSVEAATKELVRFVVHEVAHHWIGNRVGFSFSWKEGITLVLERYFGNVLLGASVNQGAKGGATTSDSAAGIDDDDDNDRQQHQEGTATKNNNNSSSNATAAAADSTKLVQVDSGKELSGLTYHKAEAAMEATVRKMGWDAFRAGVQRIVHGGGEYISDQDIVKYFKRKKKG